MLKFRRKIIYLEINLMLPLMLKLNLDSRAHKLISQAKDNYLIFNNKSKKFRKAVMRAKKEMEHP